jgi:hypothetical protein
MPTNITPADAWTTPVPIPNNGEPANQASISQYIQPIADRLEFLRKRIIGASSQSIRLHVPIQTQGTNANWAVDANTGYLKAAASINTAQSLYLPLQAFGAIVSGGPSSPTITQMGIMLLGATGHAALPATMPKLELVQWVTAAALGGNGAIPETVLATQSDTSANTAAYQVWHNVQQTLGVPPAYNPTAQWALKLTNEAGANALAGLLAGHAWIEVTGT